MGTAPQMNPVMLNAQARSIVAGNAVKMTQNILSTSINPATSPQVNVQPRNVGLILGFIVEISGTVLNTAAAQLDRTGLGSSNILRSVAFNDLNNVQRINTTGSHLALLNSARQGFGFGGAYAPNLPMGYGNNYSPFQGPASIAAGANTGAVRHTFYVPLAYSQNDLRGAIYASVVNATMNLQLNLNASPCVAAATAGNTQLNAIYTGNALGGWQGNLTLNVYQVYLDQIPMANGVPFLPMQDLNTIYDIKNTAQTGLTTGQDFPINYANFRQFLSTVVINDNAGQFNAGTDVNYFSLVAANSTNIFKVTPNIAALLARQTFMTDPPSGVYYFEHRDKPIDTITYGNQQLVVNPSVCNAGQQLIVGYEAFQQTNSLPSAASLD